MKAGDPTILNGSADEGVGGLVEIVVVAFGAPGEIAFSKRRVEVQRAADGLSLVLSWASLRYDRVSRRTDDRVGIVPLVLSALGGVRNDGLVREMISI
jgi:hypothetical protein